MMDYSRDDFISLKTAPKHAPHWDADLKSYAYLQWFTDLNPKWFSDFAAIADGAGKPAHRMKPDELAREVRYILDLTQEREARFAEIIDQDDANGAVGYWLGMLGIDPIRHPATYLMIRIGRRVGEHVVMCLKDHFEGARPSQLCPAIVPMIDPPATPSFPSGHALQAYLISHLLAGAFQDLPQTNAPSSATDAASGPLYDLAERVAENRIVAGVHFRCDNAAGRAVAYACYEGLQKVGKLWDANEPNSLISRVRQEFPHF